MALPSSCDVKSGRYFRPSFSLALGELEKILKSWTQKEPWLRMCSAGDSRGEVIDMMRNDQMLHSWSKKSFSSRCSVKKRRPRDKLFEVVDYERFWAELVQCLQKWWIGREWKMRLCKIDFRKGRGQWGTALVVVEDICGHKEPRNAGGWVCSSYRSTSWWIWASEISACISSIRVCRGLVARVFSNLFLSTDVAPVFVVYSYRRR